MQWYILVLISALFLGISEIIKKRILVKEHTIEFLTTYFSIIFILTLFFIHKVNFSLSLSEFFLIFIKTIILFTALFMFMKTLKHQDISKVSPIKNLSIVSVVLFAFLFFNETLSLYNYIGITLILIGTYFVETDPDLENPIKPIKIFKNKYSIYIFIYLIAIGLNVMLDKQITKTVDPYTLLFFMAFFLALICWIIQLVFYNGFKDISTSFKVSYTLLIFAALFNLVSDIFYLKAVAIPETFVALIIPLKRIQTLISSFFGGKIFHEKHLLIRITGTIIMILGTVLVLT